MAKSQEKYQKGDPTSAFDARIDKLRQDGVHSRVQGKTIPWAEATGLEKLDAIVWAAFNTSLNAPAVPGADTLASIERDIDYNGLPSLQKEMLRAVRQEIDAGLLPGPLPKQGMDRTLLALNWIGGIDSFDRELERYKADRLPYRPHDGPWADLSESGKVSALVGLACHEGPPGAHALATIEREVDYDRLPPWRRNALEGLRARLDAGELIGHQPNDTRDRASYALRLAEFEARVEDYKHFGGLDFWDVHRRWEEFSEGDKLDKILGARVSVDLHFEPREYEIIEREVDLTRLPEWRRRGIEQNRGISVLCHEEYELRRNAPHEPPNDAAVAFTSRIEAPAVPNRLPSPSEIADRRGSPSPERSRDHDNGKQHESDKDRDI